MGTRRQLPPLLPAYGPPTGPLLLPTMTVGSTGAEGLSETGGCDGTGMAGGVRGGFGLGSRGGSGRGVTTGPVPSASPG